MHWMSQIRSSVKAFLTWTIARLFRGPRQRGRPISLTGATRILLVRVDNRVGDALLMTPLLSTLRADPRGFSVELLVHEKTARVLEGHPAIDELHTVNPRKLWLRPACSRLRKLRRAQFDAVIDCTNWEKPSVTAAILSRVVARGAPVIGPSTAPCGQLRDIEVTPLDPSYSEIDQRLHLLSPLGNLPVVKRLSFRKPRIGEFGEFLASYKLKPMAVVNPGGRLSARRAPLEAFKAACAELLAMGIHPLITWGPGESSIAEAIAKAAPGSERAPPTDIDQLAALMQSAKLTVCNNSGPMHLAVAVNCPTLTFFFQMDPKRWGYEDAPHRILDLTELRSVSEVEAVVRPFIRRFAALS